MHINWSGPLTLCWCSRRVSLPADKRFGSVYESLYKAHLSIHSCEAVLECTDRMKNKLAQKLGIS